MSISSPAPGSASISSHNVLASAYARMVIRRDLRHLPAYPEAVPSELSRPPVTAGPPHQREA